jgi:integrase
MQPRIQRLSLEATSTCTTPRGNATTDTTTEGEAYYDLAPLSATTSPSSEATRAGEHPNTDDEKPKRNLSSEELARLLAAVPSKHRLIFRTAAETGLRLAEVLGLTWQDVSYHASGALLLV